MSDKELLQQIQDEFIGRIMRKNSWGKNEVIEAWKDSLVKILMEKIQCQFVREFSEGD